MRQIIILELFSKPCENTGLYLGERLVTEIHICKTSAYQLGKTGSVGEIAEAENRVKDQLSAQIYIMGLIAMSILIFDFLVRCSCLFIVLFLLSVL